MSLLTFFHSFSGQIRCGDAVSFETPESYSKFSRSASAISVFRVIGLPVDTIDFDSKYNYTVNGNELNTHFEVIDFSNVRLMIGVKSQPEVNVPSAEVYRSRFR